MARQIMFLCMFFVYDDNKKEKRSNIRNKRNRKLPKSMYICLSKK